jgi:hypothetical protein
VLALYYAIGGYISVQSRAARWGSNAIGTISELLQQELPGLRGFSETSIKRMRIFYEAWCCLFENRPLSADDLQNSIIPVGDKGHRQCGTGVHYSIPVDHNGGDAQNPKLPVQDIPQQQFLAG